MKKRTAIYLDVCALSRPFDDQDYLRIRLETESVNLILSRVRNGEYRLVYSPVHNKEIDAIEEPLERIELQTLLGSLSELVRINTNAVRKRAENLISLGFGIADAAHVAYAEAAGAALITCDDRLVKQCMKHDVKIWCGSPVAYCEKEGLK